MGKKRKQNLFRCRDQIIKIILVKQNHNKIILTQSFLRYPQALLTHKVFLTRNKSMNGEAPFSSHPISVLQHVECYAPLYSTPAWNAKLCLPTPSSPSHHDTTPPSDPSGPWVCTPRQSVLKDSYGLVLDMAPALWTGNPWVLGTEVRSRTVVPKVWLREPLVFSLSGSLLEKQNLRCHPRPSESEDLNKISKRFKYTVKSGKQNRHPLGLWVPHPFGTARLEEEQSRAHWLCGKAQRPLGYNLMAYTCHFLGWRNRTDCSESGRMAKFNVIYYLGEGRWVVIC